MAQIHVPEVDDFADQLGALVGKRANISEHGSPLSFDASTAQSGIYVTRDDHLAAILRVDLALGAHLGAALAMIPLDASTEAIKEGKLDADLFDAFREVVNVMASLMCRDGSPHVRLASVNSCDPSLRDEFFSTLRDPETRLDLEVEIEDYGSGTLNLRTRRLD